MVRSVLTKFEGTNKFKSNMGYATDGSTLDEFRKKIKSEPFGWPVPKRQQLTDDEIYKMLISAENLKNY